MEKWFDPAFQEFVNKELIARTPENTKVNTKPKSPSD
jgi:hypothetical protein